MLVREGISKIISLENDIKIVGQAEDGEQAISLIMENDVDIALLDVNMPKLDGIEACRKIKHLKPEIGVIALTIHEQSEYLLEFIKAGASAYLLKDVSSGQLVDTIRGVFRGHSYMPTSLISSVFEEINRLSQKPAINELTSRELDVLQLIAKGECNKKIGKSLFISEKTVKNHLYKIFQKLEVDDRTQAALYAIKNNLVDRK
jgi:DNA-binding NarL/FixJ family response regulator